MANKYVKKTMCWLGCRLVAKLPDGMSFSVLADLTRKLGIDTVTAEGKLGRIEGFPDDMVFAAYCLEHDYQPELRKLIDDCLGAAGGVFLDIGANIGLTTISVARRSDVRCHAFEPEPNNFALLKRNVSANAPEANVRFHNLALFRESSSVTFELSDDNRGDHRIRQDSLIQLEKFNEAGRRNITVAAEPLDSLIDVSEISGRLILKIDTQGGEVNVFKGAVKALARADYVISEFCPYMLLRAGTKAEEFISVMKSFPYAAILVDHSQERPSLKPVDEVASELATRVPFDGSAARHLDLIMARHSTL